MSPALTQTGIETSVEPHTSFEANFESAMRQHQSMVFSLAYHFLADRGLAEEVAQEVFLNLYRNLDALRSPGHTVGWLRRVTVQRSIDQARQRQRRPRISLEDAAEPTATPSSAGPADVLRDTALWKMVATLPEIPRMVVILRYQEDLSPAEIAAALDRPVATVKSHLQRALALLRDKSYRRFGPGLGETL